MSLRKRRSSLKSKCGRTIKSYNKQLVTWKRETSKLQKAQNRIPSSCLFRAGGGAPAPHRRRRVRRERRRTHRRRGEGGRFLPSMREDPDFPGYYPGVEGQNLPPTATPEVITVV